MEEVKKGFRKENIKHLFRWQGFWKELPWLLVILLIIVSAWAYKTDVTTCRQTLIDLQENPCKYCQTSVIPISNLTNPYEKSIEDWLNNSNQTNAPE